MSQCLFTKKNPFELQAGASSSKPSNRNELLFTDSNKMSLFSLEKRIDYHLSRIMKGHRLVNFKNSLERLPTEDRICECILEVLLSCANMINRKKKFIAEAHGLLEEMKEFLAVKKTKPSYNSGVLFQNQNYAKQFLVKLNQIKRTAMGLEIISWALNSNKEHIKYIAKVFAVPHSYQRSEFHEPCSLIHMRKLIAKTVKQCEHVIYICRGLRCHLSKALIEVYVAHYD